MLPVQGAELDAQSAEASTEWGVPRRSGTATSAEHRGGEGKTKAIQHFSEPTHGVLFPGCSLRVGPCEATPYTRSRFVCKLPAPRSAADRTEYRGGNRRK